MFGDSLSAAYGIAQSRGWVALLAERLKRERPDYSVVNASISGETTARRRARASRARWSSHKPAIVILELGANDGLRGLPVAQMKQNLARMIGEAQKAGARVLLVGMKLPPNYGPDYTRAFESAFAELAKSPPERAPAFPSRGHRREGRATSSPTASTPPRPRSR